MRAVPLKHIATLCTERRRTEPGPVITLDQIESGTGRLISNAWSDLREAPEVGAADTCPGDVLVGKLRPYLAKVLLVRLPAYASTELLCLRRKAQVDPRWLFYVMLSRPMLDQAVSTSQGTKMPRANWERLGSFALEVPVETEQRAVADFLDAELVRLDALIAGKCTLVELLGERRRGLIELAVRDLAVAWGEISLKFVVDCVTVGIVVTPAAWYASAGVPALRGLNVEAGLINVEGVVHITEQGHALHRKSALREGDVVVVRTGQAGAAAVVPPELAGANCIDLILIRPGRRISARFLEYVLNSDWTQKHVEAHSVGTIQNHFNVAAMKSLPVPRAPIEEQLRIANDLSEPTRRIDKTLGLLNRQIALLKERRQALITAAVTGQLDIPGAA